MRFKFDGHIASALSCRRGDLRLLGEPHFRRLLRHPVDDALHPPPSTPGPSLRDADHVIFGAFSFYQAGSRGLRLGCSPSTVARLMRFASFDWIHRTELSLRRKAIDLAVKLNDLGPGCLLPACVERDALWSVIRR
jgi:hypothetical protein